MKQTLKEVLHEIDLYEFNKSNLIWSEEFRYNKLKDFIINVCEEQKIQCFKEAELIAVGVEWFDNGNYERNWIISESSVLDCKNVAEDI